MEKLNPANRLSKTSSERKRVPMSVPVRRLEVPDLPGFHLHWFNGTKERIQRAVDAGYEYVNSEEIEMNAVALGSNTAASGNTDLGSRVSVVSGTDVGNDNQPLRLVLMKIKQEWYEEDQKIAEARNDDVAAALRGSLGEGTLGQEGARDRGDVGKRYVDKARTSIPDLFKPKPQRARPA